MTTVAQVFAHLLFAYLVLLNPLLGVRFYHRLITQVDHVPGARLRYYRLLIAWDWAYVLLGGRSDVLLGITHLIVDIWVIVIVTSGLKKVCGVPLPLGIVLNVLWILPGLPLAVVFMHSPV